MNVYSRFDFYPEFVGPLTHFCGFQTSLPSESSFQAGSHARNRRIHAGHILRSADFEDAIGWLRGSNKGDGWSEVFGSRWARKPLGSARVSAQITGWHTDSSPIGAMGL